MLKVLSVQHLVVVELGQCIVDFGQQRSPPEQVLIACFRDAVSHSFRCSLKASLSYRDDSTGFVHQRVRCLCSALCYSGCEVLMVAGRSVNSC